MSEADTSASDSRSLPLIAVVSAVPMLREALADAFNGIAEVRGFPAGGGDTTGLLRWLRPDAVVVDAESETEPAAVFARESDTPLVYVSYSDERLQVLTDAGWEDSEEAGASPQSVRNILVAGIYGRGGKVPTP